MTEAPSQMAARTLKLVANCLIKLANLAEAKVSYHYTNKPEALKIFLNEVCHIDRSVMVKGLPMDLCMHICEGFVQKNLQSIDV